MAGLRVRAQTSAPIFDAALAPYIELYLREFSPHLSIPVDNTHHSQAYEAGSVLIDRLIYTRW